jgi:hypothetical protein
VKTTRVLAFFALFLAGAGGCGGNEDNRDPVWGYIAPVIIAPNCATSSCHSQGSAVAGLDLSTADSAYKSLLQLHLPLLTQMPPPATTRPLVLPYNPDESRLMNMLRAAGAYRMPPDRPLAEGDIDLIARWIATGAPKN